MGLIWELRSSRASSPARPDLLTRARCEESGVFVQLHAVNHAVGDKIGATPCVSEMLEDSPTAQSRALLLPPSFPELVCSTKHGR